MVTIYWQGSLIYVNLKILDWVALKQSARFRELVSVITIRVITLMNFVPLTNHLKLRALPGTYPSRTEILLYTHTLADTSGQAHGGHLAPDTIVFACEWVIEAFDGIELEREFDSQTGLPLWNI